MERLTFVDEKGNVLFTPKNCSEDVGYTIIQLVEGGHIDLLNEIANRLANYEQRLKLFEDSEKQGLLLRLPCKVGDTVYAIEASEEEFEHFHCGLRISKCEFDFWMIPLFGKCVFLTQYEAEETLKKMTEAAGTKEIISGKEKK